MVKVFLYYTVLFTTTKEGWYHIFINVINLGKCDCFLQLTEYKIEKIAKSACIQSCWGNAQSHTAVTIHSDVHASKANVVIVFLYYIVLFTTCMVKEGWYHFFIIWVIKRSKSGHAHSSLYYVRTSSHSSPSLHRPACMTAMHGIFNCTTEIIVSTCRKMHSMHNDFPLPLGN